MGPKSLERFGGQEKRLRDLLSPCNWVTVGRSCRLSQFLDCSPGTVGRVPSLLELQVDNTWELSPNLDSISLKLFHLTQKHPTPRNVLYLFLQVSTAQFTLEPYFISAWLCSKEGDAAAARILL